MFDSTFFVVFSCAIFLVDFQKIIVPRLARVADKMINRDSVEQKSSSKSASFKSHNFSLQFELLPDR